MVECVFTLDYEIFGNGTGSLLDQVYEPARKLKSLFEQSGARFVLFAEVAELEMIERAGTDPALERVTRQIREFHADGFELGLHMHPWWYNAHSDGGQWRLDDSEYNLCTLPEERIRSVVDRSLAHLRRLVGVADFVPLSFRAGHLLFQPTQTVAKILYDRGIRVDSSVYKGGLWRQQKQDYRRALKNGYYWRFTDCATIPDPDGSLLEVPIHTRMVPSWMMFTGKRVGLERKNASVRQTTAKVLHRLSDFLRVRRPLKLDFCTMTIDELTSSVDRVLAVDCHDRGSFKPIVAIGHSKELVDFDTVASFLSYLREKRVGVSTFQGVYDRCLG